MIPFPFRSCPLERDRDLVFFRTRRRPLFEEEVLHPDHGRELDWRGVLSGRFPDDRGRIDRDEPADASLISLADGCRKRRGGALSQMRDGPRQM
jgi:hypothetical protein